MNFESVVKFAASIRDCSGFARDSLQKGGPCLTADFRALSSFMLFFWLSGEWGVGNFSPQEDICLTLHTLCRVKKCLLTLPSSKWGEKVAHAPLTGQRVSWVVVAGVGKTARESEAVRSQV